jgi:hypothetical protein
MELFDLVKTMFTDSKKYSTIKNSDKSKNFFMVNRFFAIKFPSTANSLNRVGINSWAIVDLWQTVASRFTKVPGWIFTKTKKTASDKLWKPNMEVAEIWMRRNEVGLRELNEMIRLHPEEMKKIFASLEKQIQVYDK